MPCPSLVVACSPPVFPPPTHLCTHSRVFITKKCPVWETTLACSNSGYSSFSPSVSIDKLEGALVGGCRLVTAVIHLAANSWYPICTKCARNRRAEEGDIVGAQGRSLRIMRIKNSSLEAAQAFSCVQQSHWKTASYTWQQMRFCAHFGGDVPNTVHLVFLAPLCSLRTIRCLCHCIVWLPLVAVRLLTASPPTPSLMPQGCHIGEVRLDLFWNTMQDNAVVCMHACM